MTDFTRTPLSEVLQAFKTGWRIAYATLDHEDKPVWVLRLGDSPTQLVLSVPSGWTVNEAPTASVH